MLHKDAADAMVYAFKELSYRACPADEHARLLDPTFGFNRKYHYIAENKIIQVFTIPPCKLDEPLSHSEWYKQYVLGMPTLTPESSSGRTYIV